MEAPGCTEMEKNGTGAALTKLRIENPELGISVPESLLKITFTLYCCLLCVQ